MCARAELLTLRPLLSYATTCHCHCGTRLPASARAGRAAAEPASPQSPQGGGGGGGGGVADGVVELLACTSALLSLLPSAAALIRRGGRASTAAHAYLQLLSQMDCDPSLAPALRSAASPSEKRLLRIFLPGEADDDEAFREVDDSPQGSPQRVSGSNYGISGYGMGGCGGSLSPARGGGGYLHDGYSDGGGSPGGGGGYSPGGGGYSHSGGGGGFGRDSLSPHSPQHAGYGATGYSATGYGCGYGGYDGGGGSPAGSVGSGAGGYSPGGYGGTGSFGGGGFGGGGFGGGGGGYAAAAPEHGAVGGGNSQYSNHLCGYSGLGLAIGEGGGSEAGGSGGNSPRV